VKLRARLSNYLGIETSPSNSNSVEVELQGQNIKRYEMINHEFVFHKFMQHERFRNQIEELLSESKNGEVLMVVGFYTTEKSQWTTS
jgi:hypothetical protein